MRPDTATTTEVVRLVLGVARLGENDLLEYYENVTKNMFGRVLRNHGIVKKEDDLYSLVGYEDLSDEQIWDLIELCESKLDEYKAKRGKRIWRHRRVSSGYVSGTLKYGVLKRARFRCELCGVSADVRALEVNHIIPRVRGGKDDPDNLQALCYSCNSMKRDRDTTDFRGVRESYSRRDPGCAFCEMPKDQLVAETELAYAVRDAFPVTTLHTLVIPKRHVSGYFELGRPELNACHRLLEQEKLGIEGRDASVKGFNVGVNEGETAGQTVFHCHLHLIPRRGGDIQDPTGGVRNVIPGKGVYR